MCNNAIYNYSYVCRETRLRYFERLRGKYRKCSYHGSRRYVICLGRKIYFIWRCINLPENPPTSMDDARTLLWPAHSYSSKVSASPSTSTSSSSKLFWPAGFPLLCLFKHLSTCWFNSSGVPDSLSLHTGQDGSSAFRFRFFTRILACAHSKSTFSKGFEKGSKRNSAYRCNFSKILSSIISPLLFCSSISKQICIYGIYCAIWIRMDVHLSIGLDPFVSLPSSMRRAIGGRGCMEHRPVRMILGMTGWQARPRSSRPRGSRGYLVKSVEFLGEVLLELLRPYCHPACRTAGRIRWKFLFTWKRRVFYPFDVE